MAASFLYDVFLSHNQADKPKVRRLAERLRSAGVRVWFDEWVIKAGDIISLKVDEGLEQSRVLLLCISPEALASGWVALERSTAIHRDPSNAGRRFIPLLLAECDLPDTLAKYKYLDFREESEAAFSELLPTCCSEEDAVHSSLQSKPQKPLAKKKLKSVKPLAVMRCKLKGHKLWVRSLAVSPDGTWIASGADDKMVKIWDLVNRKCRATLIGHTDSVTSIAITTDGTRIISGSNDKTIRVWNASLGKELAVLCGHTDWVVSVVAMQDNSRVLSGGLDRKLRMWDINSGLCIKTIECGMEIFNIAVSRMDTWAISGHRDGGVRLWNLESGECLMTLKGHSGIVRSVQITIDGLFAVSGSEDKTIKIWDLKAGSCSGTLEGHQHGVDSVVISPDGTLIASTGWQDLTVRLWDWKSGVCLQVITLPINDDPMFIAFSPDGSRLVFSTSDHNIYIYRLTSVRSKPPVEVTRRYVNAKVVLLGEGTVGKTSLAHRLIEDKYVIRDRTHGMNVWRLELLFSSDAMLEREALLWDLAGQEDYRLIHQLFLDQTALALLLINPQKEDPFVEAGEWLKALKSAAGMTFAAREAARLLIFSQVDVGGMKLSNAKIERFREEHGFQGWLPTSAKTGENCSESENGGKPSRLKELIAASIPWDKLPWTTTPRLLAELKKAVMAMRDESDIRLLRFAELAQRLEQMLPSEKFGESDLRTAVTLLANHGLARPLKFGDLVLLRPDLINGYAGAVIRAARAHTDEIGCVLEAEIYREEFDFTGVERLKNRADEELLLRALVQTFLDHSLCIAEETPNGRHLVFPSQYRREKDTPKNPDIFVSYTFSGEWQTVWTTLVVRLWYSQEFENRELWRNAAEFASSRGHTLGLLINKEGNGAATISLFFDVEVPDELKVIFIEYVHRHLAKYACEVTRDRRYICPECGKPVKDIDVVRKRLDAKKEFITCQECDERVPLVDFIEQRLKSDPVARKILAMDETATRQLDTQAQEQILIGHMMAISGEANQIFRPVMMFDYGIDGEVEFRDNDGKASGKKIYVQLKIGNSYLRTRKGDGCEVFDVTNERHLEYWVKQPVDVYLVIRQKEGMSSDGTIRWMNVTRNLKNRADKQSRQIIFAGEKLDASAVWKVRDQILFPPKEQKSYKKRF
ncbi:MAG: TIR domain-containing protein [Chlorobium sp.]|nr:MAG: TIR domain-containing protein [Chlorobium sp.]